MGGIAASSVVDTPLEILALLVTKAAISVDAAKTVRSVTRGNRITIVDLLSLDGNTINLFCCLGKKVRKTTKSLSLPKLSFLAVATKVDFLCG